MTISPDSDIVVNDLHFNNFTVTTNFWNNLVCYTFKSDMQYGKPLLAKGEWKFRVASNIHFILAGLASNSCKASRNLKTIATITGVQL